MFYFATAVYLQIKPLNMQNTEVLSSDPKRAATSRITRSKVQVKRVSKFNYIKSRLLIENRMGLSQMDCLQLKLIGSRALILLKYEC